MDKDPKFTARITRNGGWFLAFSPEFPEGHGQGLNEEEALESLRQSIQLLEDGSSPGEQASSASGTSNAWDHLSAFSGSVGDDFEIPERDKQHRDIPDLE